MYSVNDLCDDLLMKPDVKEVRLSKVQEQQQFTHVVSVVNRQNQLFMKILFNAETGIIIRKIEIETIVKLEKVKHEVIQSVDVNEINSIDRDKMMKLISGAVRNCIQSHGPITLEFISSASKRIAANIFARIANDRKKNKKSTAM